MMRILLFLLIFIPIGLKAQQTEPDSSTLEKDFEFEYSDAGRARALKDIRKKKMKLLLIGGVAPTLYSNQHRFESKFHVEYFDFGCMPPKESAVIEYNKEIFKYLDKNYGNAWRKEARPDVVGL